MGYLNQGKWVDKWYDTKQHKGEFKRESSQFRALISVDHETFKPEANRYHLYVSYACPWAHRTLIFRQLKQLESLISVSIVDPLMLDHGWVFNNTFPDHIHQTNYLYQIYAKSNPTYVGRVTVPVLWDKQTHQIVNNESADIIRLFNSAFNDITGNKLDFYPKQFRDEIELMNDKIYHNVNNGVYKAGFATTQPVYKQAVTELFKTLDQLENHLETRDYLVGNQLTEADWRLFTTLVRFDSVYVGHFKCNLKRIKDYPNLSKYVNRLYHYPGIQQTVVMEHIKTHYYASHLMINPTGIVPEGPLELFG